MFCRNYFVFFRFLFPSSSTSPSPCSSSPFLFFPFSFLLSFPFPFRSFRTVELLRHWQASFFFLFDVIKFSPKLGPRWVKNRHPKRLPSGTSFCPCLGVRFGPRNPFWAQNVYPYKDRLRVSLVYSSNVYSFLGIVRALHGTGTMRRRISVTLANMTIQSVKSPVKRKPRRNDSTAANSSSCST